MDIQSVIVSVEELNKTKKAIADAIRAKGVNSKGRFSKFPDEINSISASAGPSVNEQDVIRSILYGTKELDWNDGTTELPDNFGQGIKFNNISLPNITSINTDKSFAYATINSFSAPNLVSCRNIFNEATITHFDMPKLQSCNSFGYLSNIKEIYLPKLVSLGSNLGGVNTTTIVLPSITDLYIFAFQGTNSATQIYLGKNLKELPVLPSNYMTDPPALTVVLDTPQAIPVSQYTDSTINQYVSHGGKLIISVLDSAYDSFKASADWNRYSQYLKKRSETPADRLEFLKKYKLN